MCLWNLDNMQYVTVRYQLTDFLKHTSMPAEKVSLDRTTEKYSLECKNNLSDIEHA